ncbi:hypothetical protein CPB85DRAFT_1356315 [Mucidula mucida]|nr:hypothetical protein CPB85DRAFT_1356315 [Mucidula mucida]
MTPMSLLPIPRVLRPYGSLDLQEVFDWHLEHNPDHRLFLFYDHSEGALRCITWIEIVHAVHRAVRFVREQVSWTPAMSSSPVVGILAVSDTVTYFTMLMSVLRSNCVVFPISIRNSPTAIAHLIQQVRVEHLLVSGDRAMQQLATQSFSLLEKDYAVPKVLPFPNFQDLYLSPYTVHPQDIPYERKGPDQIVLYIHSSGSTAHPKPVGYTNLNNLQSMHIPWYGEVDLTGSVISVHAVAMFHVMGVVQLPSTASCGYTLAVFDPKKPPHAPTPAIVFSELQATNCDYVVCVPAFPEAWSKDAEKVRWLSSCAGVISGGGGFNYEIGQYLRSQGVKIIPCMDRETETGAISVFMPEACPEFEYFRLAAYISPHFIAQGHDDAFELVLKAGTLVSPVVVNTRVDNVDAYATSDLLQPHPTRHGFWRVFGRRDDQIMHSTGEKTNAGPLESILNQDRNVLSCVVFGRGKPQAGVLVDPIPTLSIDSNDSAALEEFRTRIWPTVQRMNEYAPQHSRIFKEMIIVASPSKPFTYTAKNTARRSAVIADYEEEIEAVYLARAHIVPPPEWTEESTLTFIRSLILSIMDKALPDDVDIFEHGCDSLQASWILNTLSESLGKSLGNDAITLDRDFVYSHPSTTGLANAFIGHITGLSRGTFRDERLCLMRALLEAELLSLCSPSERIVDIVRADPEEHVVLITGTTGALGSYILSELIKDATVRTIYALNRYSSGEQELNERQRRAFESRGLDPLLLVSGKVRFLEGTLASEQLGLSQDVYSFISNSVTHIIHNAWPVNFRHSLLSFKSSIKGARNVISLALTSPVRPKLTYISSVSVLQNSFSQQPIPERSANIVEAIGTGYSESKWVAENLFEKASSLGLVVDVVRVGQLCGGVNGCWNAWEWIPAMIRSATVLGNIPDVAKDIALLRLNDAGKAVNEYRVSQPNVGLRFLHLVQPRPLPWTSLAQAIARILNVSLVNYGIWLTGLAACPVQVPASHLLGFYERDFEPSAQDAFGMARFDCSLALANSESLRACESDLTGDVPKWIEWWESVRE